MWKPNVQYHNHKCLSKVPILSQINPIQAHTFHFMRNANNNNNNNNNNNTYIHTYIHISSESANVKEQKNQHRN